MNYLDMLFFETGAPRCLNVAVKPAGVTEVTTDTYRQLFQLEKLISCALRKEVMRTNIYRPLIHI